MENQYNQKILKYVTKGYAEKIIDVSNMENRKNLCFLLPHFPVFHPKKPGKLRLVFDAAAKCEEKNLNDFLLTGPDLVSSLFGVLCRTRRHEITFSGDIAEMFHQVKIADHSVFCGVI
jgi:hypothetical protein